MIQTVFILSIPCFLSEKTKHCQPCNTKAAGKPEMKPPPAREVPSKCRLPVTHPDPFRDKDLIWRTCSIKTERMEHTRRKTTRIPGSIPLRQICFRRKNQAFILPVLPVRHQSAQHPYRRILKKQAHCKFTPNESGTIQ